VPSRLIGQKVNVKLGAETIEVTHQGVFIQRMPRLIGSNGTSINYRHVIDSLVRKPGAFENYKYREELFPTSYFRMAYDRLLEAHSLKVADKNYLKLLELAAHESQDAVQDVLRLKIQLGESIDVDEIRLLVLKAAEIPPVTCVEVEPPSLSEFDCLLDHPDMESPFNDQKISDPEDLPRAKTSREDPVRVATDEPQETGPDAAVDRAVPGTSPAELPGSVCSRGRPSGAGEPKSLGIPFGADDDRMRGAAGGSDQALDDAIQTAVGQELGVVRVEPSSTHGDPPDGNASRRNILGSPGKPADFWQARFGKKPRLVRTHRAVDPTVA